MPIKVRLKELLKEAGMTQDEFEKITKIPTRSILSYLYEKDYRNIHIWLEDLEKMCLLFKVSPNQIFQYSPDKVEKCKKTKTRKYRSSFARSEKAKAALAISIKKATAANPIMYTKNKRKEEKEES